jgi:hypothetical protein
MMALRMNAEGTLDSEVRSDEGAWNGSKTCRVLLASHYLNNESAFVSGVDPEFFGEVSLAA